MINRLKESERVEESVSEKVIRVKNKIKRFRN